MKTLILITALLVGCGGGNNYTTSIDKPKVKIVCIGDSETAGSVSTPSGSVLKPEASYPSNLQKLLGDSYIVTNLGINSSNIVEVFRDQVTQAVALKPDIIIVSTTLNDAGDSLSFQEINKTLAMIQRLSNTRVILLTPLREGSDVKNIQSYRDNLYTNGMEVIDVAKYQNYLWYCGNVDIHPCEYGYAEMARVVFDYIKR